MRPFFSRSAEVWRARFEVCDCAWVDALKNKALKQISVTPDAMSQRRRFALRPLRGHKEFLRVLKLLLHNPEIFSAKQDLSGCQAELWNRSLKLKSAHHNIKATLLARVGKNRVVLLFSNTLTEHYQKSAVRQEFAHHEPSVRVFTANSARQ